MSETDDGKSLFYVLSLEDEGEVVWQADRLILIPGFCRCTVGISVLI